jgi:hypothetical protein
VETLALYSQLEVMEVFLMKELQGIALMEVHGEKVL